MTNRSISINEQLRRVLRRGSVRGRKYDAAKHDWPNLTCYARWCDCCHRTLVKFMHGQTKCLSHRVMDPLLFLTGLYPTATERERRRRIADANNWMDDAELRADYPTTVEYLEYRYNVRQINRQRIQRCLDLRAAKELERNPPPANLMTKSEYLKAHPGPMFPETDPFWYEKRTGRWYRPPRRYKPEPKYGASRPAWWLYREFDEDEEPELDEEAELDEELPAASPTNCPSTVENEAPRTFKVRLCRIRQPKDPSKWKPRPLDPGLEASLDEKSRQEYYFPKGRG